MSQTMDPTKTPALPPPPGELSDFNAPDPFHAVSLFSVIFCLSLCTILLTIQLLTKHLCMNGLRWEDYITVLGWAAFVPYCALGLHMVHLGLVNKHQWNVSIIQMVDFLYFVNIISIIYILLMIIIKSAVLLQYLRIFVPSRTRTFYLTWLLIAVNIIFNLGLLFAIVFQCIPRRKIWSPSVSGRCTNVGATNLLSTVSNTITDFGTLLLPTYTIWCLQMPLKRKWRTSAVFAIGLIGCALSLVRLALAFKLMKAEDMTYMLTGEYHWSWLTSMVFVRIGSLGEVTSGIVCCCLTSFPKFCRVLAGQARRSWQRITTTTSGQMVDESWGGTKVVPVRERRDPYVELDDLKTLSTDSNRQQPFGMKYRSDVEEGIGT